LRHLKIQETQRNELKFEFEMMLDFRAKIHQKERQTNRMADIPLDFDGGWDGGNQ